MELVTRRDIIAFLEREPDGASSRQIAHALHSTGLGAAAKAIGLLLGYMRRDGLVTGRDVSLGGKRGTVTTWRLTPTSTPRKPRRLRMVAHAHRPERAMRRHDCAHETACVAQIADLEPSAEACECPPKCPHLVETPMHVRIALAQPRRAPNFDGGDDEAGR